MLVAVIVKVYAVAAAKLPVTVKGEVVPDVDKAIEGLEVVVYEVIEAFPVLPAVNGIETVVVFVTDAVPIVGAPGAANIKELDAEEAGLTPAVLVAVTVYVRVPATVSVTTTGLDAPVLDAPDELVTVYWVIGNLLVGAVKVTDALPLPAVAVPIVGATGTLLAPEPCAPRIGMCLFYPVPPLLST